MTICIGEVSGLVLRIVVVGGSAFGGVIGADGSSAVGVILGFGGGIVVDGVIGVGGSIVVGGVVCVAWLSPAV